MFAADLGHNARNKVQLARPRHHLCGIIQIDSFQRGGKPVRITFAADFPVGDDVQAGAFLLANRQDSGIVLRFFEKLGRDAPKVGSAQRAGRR